MFYHFKTLQKTIYSHQENREIKEVKKYINGFYKKVRTEITYLLGILLYFVVRIKK